MKARYEDSGVKAATWKESIKAGLATRERTRKGAWANIAPKTQEGMRKHRAIWRKHAMRLTAKQAAVNIKKFAGDFDTFISRATTVVPWETIPSQSLDHEIFNGSYEQKLAFTRDALKLIVDEDGHDMLAEQIGVPLAYVRHGDGTWEGHLNPNLLSHLIPTKEAGKFTKDHARAYARAIQYIYKQDTVPFYRPDNRVLLTKKGPEMVKFGVGKEDPARPGTTKRFIRKFTTQQQAEAFASEKDGYVVMGSPFARGLSIQFDLELTVEKEREILAALETVFGDEADFTKRNTNEIHLINFKNDETRLPFVDDEEFIDKGAIFVADYSAQLGITGTKSFHSEGEGGYYHNWGTDPEGRPVLNQRGISGRPDLQNWVRDRRKAFDQLLEEYTGDRLRAIEDTSILFQEGEIEGGPRTRRLGQRRDQRSGTAPDVGGLPVNEEGRVELVHFSRLEGLQQLDPSLHGTEISGAESTRKQNDPDNWVDRTYYAIRGGGYRKEVGLGPHQYTASIDPDRIYDFVADPDGLRAQVKLAKQNDPFVEAISLYERLIHEAGYAGYQTSQIGNVAAIFESLEPDSYELNPTDVLFQDDDHPVPPPYAEQLKGILEEDTPLERSFEGIRGDKFSTDAEYLYALNRAAQAAKRAHTQGNRAGVAKERARMQAIVQRMKDRHQTQGNRRELKRKIMREVSLTKTRKGKSRFGPDIQSKLDIFRKAMNTKKETFRAMIAQNAAGGSVAAAGVSLDIAEENELYAIALNFQKMSESELYDLYQDIKDYKATGRQYMFNKNQLRADRRQLVKRTTPTVNSDLR